MQVNIELGLLLERRGRNKHARSHRSVMARVVASGQVWEACGAVASAVSRATAGDSAMGGNRGHTEPLLLSPGCRNM